MVDEDIKVKYNGFWWTGKDQMRIIVGMRVAYLLPLEHPLSVFVERLTEQVRTGDLRAFAGLLAELTATPPSEEVSALLQKILQQMADPALDTEGMRTLCAFYLGLVELLPTDPWLYWLLESEVRHWTDETPDRMLLLIEAVYLNREEIRRRDHGCFEVGWRGNHIEPAFRERKRAFADFVDTAARPAVKLAPKTGKQQRIGPHLLGLPSKAKP